MGGNGENTQAGAKAPAFFGPAKSLFFNAEYAERRRGELKSGGGNSSSCKRGKADLTQRTSLDKLGTLSEFAGAVGIPYTTLATWRRRFEKDSPDGLMDKPREYKESGSRLPEVTKRAILMISDLDFTMINSSVKILVHLR